MSGDGERRHRDEGGHGGKNDQYHGLGAANQAAFDSPEYWNPKVRGAECLNRQAARSIVPIAELRTTMVMAGHSKAEIVSAVKAAFDNKQLPDLESGMQRIPCMQCLSCASLGAVWGTVFDRPLVV